jgi:hypothetical protein
VRLEKLSLLLADNGQMTLRKRRAISGILTAVGFGAYVVIGLVAMTLPILGAFVFMSVALISPVLWIWIVVAGKHAPLPMSPFSAEFMLASMAPLPLIGLVLGYAWPLPEATSKVVIGAIGYRFVMCLALLSAVGLWFMAFY